mgnify:CR=1 FL=1
MALPCPASTTRCAPSLSYLLSMYPGTKLYFVAPKVCG